MANRGFALCQLGNTPQPGAPEELGWDAGPPDNEPDAEHEQCSL